MPLDLSLAVRKGIRERIVKLRRNQELLGTKN